MAEQLTFELAGAPAADVRELRRRAQRRGGRHARAARARSDARETGLVLWGAGGVGQDAPAEGRGRARARARTGRALCRRSLRASSRRCARGAMRWSPWTTSIAPTTRRRAGCSRCTTRLRRAAGSSSLRRACRRRACRCATTCARASGWGLVIEIVPLADADKPAALAAFAQAARVRAAADAIAYLLAHGRRDMATLVATLAALDQHSLALQRPITVPLIREWLQRGAWLCRRVRPAVGASCRGPARNRDAICFDDRSCQPDGFRAAFNGRARRFGTRRP